MFVDKTYLSFSGNICTVKAPEEKIQLVGCIGDTVLCSFFTNDIFGGVPQEIFNGMPIVAKIVDIAIIGTSRVRHRFEVSAYEVEFEIDMEDGSEVRRIRHWCECCLGKTPRGTTAPYRVNKLSDFRRYSEWAKECFAAKKAFEQEWMKEHPSPAYLET